MDDKLVIVQDQSFRQDHTRASLAPEPLLPSHAVAKWFCVMDDRMVLQVGKAMNWPRIFKVGRAAYRVEHLVREVPAILALPVFGAPSDCQINLAARLQIAVGGNDPDADAGSVALELSRDRQQPLCRGRG